ncbi:hypothetical protein CcCBS67573_g05809 [Chytriomyces confervae]|uniref:Uncharacterized protein n=1 Tax=Chytriomyces confervae TaxID=246404 RepID=A0A507FB01_9FUNG|nr:hypothetical protein CcCBS67573_g05809 [Chytriomyces confervae]
MHPVITIILLGAQTDSSPLSIFKRDNDALRLIITLVQESWASHVKRTDTATKMLRLPIQAGLFVLPQPIPFPAPLMDDQGVPVPVHVNMMPFKMVYPDPHLSSCHVRYPSHEYCDAHVAKALPDNLKRYAAIVAACLRRVPDEWGQVGYITVHESYVEEGKTQRRPGLHIESPGMAPPGQSCMDITVVNMKGGIFVASNMADTCRVWDCLIEDHGKVVGHLGDISHLRKAIGGNEAGTSLGAGEICWMTDRTPHESLPQPKAGFRQFFRLVTSELSAWYEEHSTPSELGVAPKCMIVKGNKFLNA